MSSLVNLARDLRRNSTLTEVKLWNHLKGRQFEGLKFRRQVPFGSYIADFVCFSKKLIIELDGGQHDEEENIQKDKTRDRWFESQGFRVLRIWNNDVIQNIDGVGEKIIEYVDTH